MGYWEDKENELLTKLYPEGTLERHVLEYSQGKHQHGEVHPMLVAAFKVLMGISILVAVVSLIAFLNTH